VSVGRVVAAPNQAIRIEVRLDINRLGSVALYHRVRYIGGVREALREPTFLILTALATGPLHGYGLITEVAKLSGGRLTLRPGTLYGALDRLGDDGLVANDREEVVDGRLRRYYRLTDEGAAVLRAETERMRLNVQAATRRLRTRDRVTGFTVLPMCGAA
jgi:DNA-binding PadR family transcriptional regulator